MEQLTAAELKQWMAKGKTFRLVDVREDFEHEHYNIGGILIPLGELMARREEVPADGPVVVYCEKGIRSVLAIQRLESAGFRNLYNLAGGMKAWRAC